MEVRQVLWLARKWFWLLLLACLIGAIAGLAVSVIQPKMYEASTTVYLVSPNRGDSNTVIGDQQRAKAFTLIPQSGPVLQAALLAVRDKSLTSKQLFAMISVVNDRDTQFVDIIVRDKNPQRAAQLATEVTKQSIAQYKATSTDSADAQQFLKQELNNLAAQIKNQEKELANLQDQTGPQASSPSQTAIINQLNASLDAKRTQYYQMFNSYTSMSSTQAIILQPAQVPTGPIGGGLKIAMLIGMLAGLVVIVAVILFIEQRSGILRPQSKHQLDDHLTNATIRGRPMEKTSLQTLANPFYVKMTNKIPDEVHPASHNHQSDKHF